MKREVEGSSPPLSFLTLPLSFYLSLYLAYLVKRHVYCLVYCLYWGRLEVPRFWQVHQSPKKFEEEVVSRHLRFHWLSCTDLPKQASRMEGYRGLCGKVRSTGFRHHDSDRQRVLSYCCGELGMSSFMFFYPVYCLFLIFPCILFRFGFFELWVVLR